MYSRYIQFCRIDKNTFLQLGLGLIWCAGLSLGLIANRFYGDALDAYILLAPLSLPEFGSSLCVTLFPLLISALAVICFRPALLCIVLFHGALLGSAICAVVGVYGGAGLMMSLLLLFRSIFCVPLLIWFWCLTLCRERRIVRSAVICSVAMAIVTAADIGLAAPLLREVMSF